MVSTTNVWWQYLSHHALPLIIFVESFMGMCIIASIMFILFLSSVLEPCAATAPKFYSRSAAVIFVAEPNL